jgi:biotin carboxyl carrier protein
VEDIVKTYRLTLEGRTFEVQVRGDPRAAEVEVEVDGLPLTVAVENLSSRPAELDGSSPGTGANLAPVPVASTPPTVASAPPAPTPTGNSVRAPLPGIVKRVAVQPGQRVTAGEALLVIEAMKMDNVLRAARDGVVDKIHAVEGHQVAHGAPLLDYQP